MEKPIFVQVNDEQKVNVNYISYISEFKDGTFTVFMTGREQGIGGDKKYLKNLLVWILVREAR